MADGRHDRIRQRAHEIWEQEGRPEGAHERHWRQAENEVVAQDARTAKKPVAARKPASAKATKPAAAKSTAPQKPASVAKAAAKPKVAAAKKA